ncbi:unnamed protein product [Albugo candida]|uniref:Uncharacterized protein n=1 Tax=Albugo candida TaxID=65357 RepID=A0A024GFX2_9STRA|nr:unnamed protein product [Albugo candida]|eukprot:CCI45602.1 unnamed protein product [Albugo candida]
MRMLYHRTFYTRANILCGSRMDPVKMVMKSVFNYYASKKPIPNIQADIREHFELEFEKHSTLSDTSSRTRHSNSTFLIIHLNIHGIECRINVLSAHSAVDLQERTPSTIPSFLTHSSFFITRELVSFGSCDRFSCLPPFDLVSFGSAAALPTPNKESFCLKFPSFGFATVLVAVDSECVDPFLLIGNLFVPLLKRRDSSNMSLLITFFLTSCLVSSRLYPSRFLTATSLL